MNYACPFPPDPSSSGPAGNQTYTTAADNRLTSDSLYDYSYDAEGNVTAKTRIADGQRTEFTWDYHNRLTEIAVKTSSAVLLSSSSNVYDLFDRRIAFTVDPDGAGTALPVTTAIVYDGPSRAANPILDFVDPDAAGPQSGAAPAVAVR